MMRGDFIFCFNSLPQMLCLTKKKKSAGSVVSVSLYLYNIPGTVPFIKNNK